MDDVIKALREPVSIRQSKIDKQVYLFYTGGTPRWMCAVIKNKKDYGFLITAYPTDAVVQDFFCL